MTKKFINSLIGISAVYASITLILTSSKVNNMNERINALQQDIIVLNQDNDYQRYQKISSRISNQNRTGVFE